MYGNGEQKATSKQIELLRSKGVSETELLTLSQKDASKRIDEIFAAQGNHSGDSKMLSPSDLLEGTDEIMSHVASTPIYARLRAYPKNRPDDPIRFDSIGHRHRSHLRSHET
jgi:hypothetical protein